MPASAFPIVDAHVHFWNIEQHRYPWLDEVKDVWFGDYASLQRNILLQDYLRDSQHYDVRACVHIQAQWDHADPVGETRWLQSLADAHGYPQGIVAFCDFRRSDARAVLEGHLAHRNLRGIRMDLNWHPDPRYRFCDAPQVVRDPAWIEGFSLLRARRLSFDLQIYAGQQGEEAYEFVRRFEDVQFILDHAGAPEDRSPEGMSRWQAALRKLATLPNVATKLSGFEMFDQRWSTQSLRDVIARVIDCFGPERCMFASNYPVSTLYGSWAMTVDGYRAALSGLSDGEQRMIFCDNAVRLYRLQ